MLQSVTIYYCQYSLYCAYFPRFKMNRPLLPSIRINQLNKTEHTPPNQVSMNSYSTLEAHDNVIFEGNTAENFGGAVSSHSSSSLLPSSLVLSDTQVHEP